MAKQLFYLQTNLFKKLFVLIVFILLVITPVNSALSYLATTFVKSTVLKAAPPEVAQAWGYLIDPAGSVKGEVLGQLQKIAPQLTEGLSIATQPDEVLKAKLLGEIAKKAESIRPGITTIVANAQEYGTYAQEALTPKEDAPKGMEYGSFDCDKQTKRCLILTPDGKKFLDFPEGFKMDFNEKDNSLTMTNTGDKPENLKVGDFNLGNLGKGGSIKFTQDKEGGASIKVNGHADLLVGDKNFFSGVTNAEFKISKDKGGKFKQIEYADFVATKPSQYGFTYVFLSGNQKTFNFKTTKSNSKVTFNSGEEYVSPFLDAENAEFNLGDQFINGGKVTVNFADNGDIDNVLLSGNNPKYVDKKRNIEVGSAGDNPVHLFFNKQGKSKYSSVSLLETEEGTTITSSGGDVYYRLNNMKITDTGIGVDESTTLFYDKKKHSGFLNCKVSCDALKGNLEYSLERDTTGTMQVSMIRESLKKQRITDKDRLFLEVEKSKFAEVDNKGDFYMKSVGGEVKTFEEKSLNERLEVAQQNAKKDAFGGVGKQKALGLSEKGRALAELSNRPTVDCSFAGKGSTERSIVNPTARLPSLKVDSSLFGSLDCMKSGKSARIDKIILHDGGAWGGNSPAASLVTFWRSTLVNEGRSISSHYFIDRNGIVYPLMEENFAGVHAGCRPQNINCIIPGMNKNSIGIDLQYMGKKTGYTPETLRSLKVLLADVTKRNGIPYDDIHIKGHYEVYAGHGDPRPGFEWQTVGLNPNAHKRWTGTQVFALTKERGIVTA